MRHLLPISLLSVTVLSAAIGLDVAAGERNPLASRSEPVEPTDLVRAGSVTKSMLTTVVRQPTSRAGGCGSCGRSR